MSLYGEINLEITCLDFLDACATNCSNTYSVICLEKLIVQFEKQTGYNFTYHPFDPY